MPQVLWEATTGWFSPLAIAIPAKIWELRTTTATLALVSVCIDLPSPVPAKNHKLGKAILHADAHVPRVCSALPTDTSV